MVLPLWGLLQKSQDDASTIEEAIASAIVAHEEDPTSHLGTGESLQAHKNDEVIDHPAGSLVPDKISRRGWVLSPTFESTSVYGSPVNSWIPVLFGIILVPDTGTGDKEKLIGSQSSSDTSYNHDDFLILQFTGMTGLTGKEGYVGMGQLLDLFNRSFCGIHIVGGKVYGYQRSWQGVATESITELVDVPEGGGKTFRIESDPNFDEVRYYYDGELKATQDFVGNPANTGAIFWLEAINTTGGIMAGMKVRNITFSTTPL